MNSKTKISILLIEDNPGDAKLTTLHLQDASIKHHLYHAESFYEAMDFCQSKPIDIALLDLSLPDSNGFKTLSNFIERTPNVPVIVLTGTNNEIVGNQAIKAGAQDFLVKGQLEGKLLGRAIRYAMQRFATMRKMEESTNELVINEKRYVDAQEMAHFGNWEMDIVNHEMKWTDEVFRIFGLQPKSFKPTLSEYLNYVHFEDRTMVDDCFEQMAKDGKVHHLEHRILIDGRSIKHVAIRGKVYYEELTSKILLVGVIQDISERKLNEQLLVEKNITNRSSQLMQQALTDTSFHVRTPLSSIINLLFLLEKSELTATQRELLSGLKISVDDMAIALNSLSNFAVLASEELRAAEEELKLQEFLQSSQRVLQIKADTAKLVLNVKGTDDLPAKIKVDAQKLSIIFYNILEYFFQSIQEGSSIDISSQLVEHNDANANLHLHISSPHLHLTDAEIKALTNAEKLLEIYNPNQEDTDSKAISVAIALRLARLLDGEINIRKKDEQVVFSLDLPVKTVIQFTATHDDQPNIPLRILLVEDHFLNQIATKKVLTTWSSLVTVDIAENGLVGVEKYREHGYDLILMDIQMPVMNGIDAAKKIREKSSVPIIALTANATKQEQDRCLQIGINDYLSKPFQPEELYHKIMNLMASIQVAATM